MRGVQRIEMDFPCQYCQTLTGPYSHLKLIYTSVIHKDTQIWSLSEKIKCPFPQKSIYQSPERSLASDSKQTNNLIRGGLTERLGRPA